MNTPTAKQYLRLLDKKHGTIWTEDDESIERAFIEFAKIHVDAALKAAAEKAMAYIGVSDEPKVSQGSILTAYPLSNIK